MKTNKCLLIVTVLIMAAACSPKKAEVFVATPGAIPAPPAVEEEEMQEEDMVSESPVEVVLVASLKRTPCFGQCPVFEAKLFSDGSATYEGKNFVEKEGFFQAEAGKEMIKLIQEKAVAIGYFEMEDQYPSSGKMIKDIPNTITALRQGEKFKQITNNHNSPIELQEFETYLLDTFESLSWVKADK